jgi:hypothetical protein
MAESLPNDLRLALDGPKGSLDAYLEIADEAQVRRDIRDLIGDTTRERRLFAAMAMQGLIPTLPTIKSNNGAPVTEAVIAEQAVVFADALLSALLVPEEKK